MRLVKELLTTPSTQLGRASRFLAFQIKLWSHCIRLLKRNRAGQQAAALSYYTIFGIVPMAMLSAVMYLNRFFQSHYLNRITTSDQRATVLSFRGLSFNLGYGIIGIGYSLLVAYLRNREVISGSPLPGEVLEKAVFIESLAWFPWYFLAAAALPVLYVFRRMRRAEVLRLPG